MLNRHSGRCRAETFFGVRFSRNKCSLEGAALSVRIRSRTAPKHIRPKNRFGDQSFPVIAVQVFDFIGADERT